MQISRDDLIKYTPDKVTEAYAKAIMLNEKPQALLDYEPQNPQEAYLKEIMISGGGGGGSDPALRTEVENARKGLGDIIHPNLSERITEDVNTAIAIAEKAGLTELSGDEIVSENTLLGEAEDVVLEGKTYQNVFKQDKVRSSPSGTCELLDNGYIKATRTSDTTGIAFNFGWERVDETVLKPNTKCTYILDVLENTCNADICFNEGGVSGANSCWDRHINIPALFTGRKVVLTTSIPIFKDNTFVVRSYGYSANIVEGNYIIYRIIILEGDYTDKPLPEYITGIESVGEKEVTAEGKYPINFITEGINLFKDIPEIPNYNGQTVVELNCNTGKKRGYYADTRDLKVGATYCFAGNILTSTDSSPSCQIMVEYTDGKQEYPAGLIKMGFSASKPFLVSKPLRRIYIYNSKPSGTNSILTVNNLMFIKEGSPSDKYVDYIQPVKTEYLLEEPLRSLPNKVSDTIDEKGVLTKRIAVTTFDGSADENWAFNGNVKPYIRFSGPCIGISAIDGYAYCDKLPVRAVVGDSRSRYVLLKNDVIYINLLETEITTQDAAGFTAWLKDNPITVYYEVAEPEITQLQPISVPTFANFTRIYQDNNVTGNMRAKLALKGTGNAPIIPRTENSINVPMDGELMKKREVLCGLEPIEAEPMTDDENNYYFVKMASEDTIIARFNVSSDGLANFIIHVEDLEGNNIIIPSEVSPIGKFSIAITHKDGTVYDDFASQCSEFKVPVVAGDELSIRLGQVIGIHDWETGKPYIAENGAKIFVQMEMVEQELKLHYEGRPVMYTDDKHILPEDGGIVDKTHIPRNNEIFIQKLKSIRPDDMYVSGNIGEADQNRFSKCTGWIQTLFTCRNNDKANAIFADYCCDYILTRKSLLKGYLSLGPNTEGNYDFSNGKGTVYLNLSFNNGEVKKLPFVFKSKEDVFEVNIDLSKYPRWVTTEDRRTNEPGLVIRANFEDFTAGDQTSTYSLQLDLDTSGATHLATFQDGKTTEYVTMGEYMKVLGMCADVLDSYDKLEARVKVLEAK